MLSARKGAERWLVQCDPIGYRLNERSFRSIRQPVVFPVKLPDEDTRSNRLRPPPAHDDEVCTRSRIGLRSTLRSTRIPPIAAVRFACSEGASTHCRGLRYPIGQRNCFTSVRSTH